MTVLLMHIYIHTYISVPVSLSVYVASPSVHRVQTEWRRGGPPEKSEKSRISLGKPRILIGN